jgi:hypothetical protein
MSFGLSDFAPTPTGRSPESSPHDFLDEARRSGFNGSPDVVAAGRGRKSACTEETACSVDEVVQRAEERILEFVRTIYGHGISHAPVD